MALADDALTLTVLLEIRDEIRTTNVRLDETRNELGARIDQTNDRLGHIETAMLDLAEQQSFVVQWLKAGTNRDRRLEEDLIKLTARLAAVEARLPATEE